MITGTLSTDDNQSTLNVRRTSNMLERMRGLLGRPPLKSDEGLLITPCNSVHMIGMRYPIDVVFLDKQFKIIRVVHSLGLWRMSSCLKASMALELPAGTAENIGLEEGAMLKWVASIDAKQQ